MSKKEAAPPVEVEKPLLPAVLVLHEEATPKRPRDRTYTIQTVLDNEEQLPGIGYMIMANGHREDWDTISFRALENYFWGAEGDVYRWLIARLAGLGKENQTLLKQWVEAYCEED